MRNNHQVSVIKEIFAGLADMAWPNLCLLCERPLMRGEQHVCLNCLYELPAVHETSFQENKTADRFLGKLEFVRAASGFRYNKDSSIQKALELLKYKGEKEIGCSLAKVSAQRLYEQGFFKDIDALIPVPLHKRKQKKRGYNQSEWIAKGMSEISHIPVNTEILGRGVHNASQTTKNLWSRWENAQGLFELKNTEGCNGMHLLLVDDVLTSGSTLEACGQVLLQLPDVRISFFALALA
ncbi:MAG: phosphoribosyltransferase family protein [Bacteroidia bacterium]|nr:phosphoribosyltransferase family protein [Bacteroidia bacterium]